MTLNKCCAESSSFWLWVGRPYRQSREVVFSNLLGEPWKSVPAFDEKPLLSLFPDLSPLSRDKYPEVFDYFMNADSAFITRLLRGMGVGVRALPQST